MTDTLDTVWDLEPHTEAKHRILREYLNAWFTILDRRQKGQRLLYVDGFAGPGEYKGGEDGSPVVALKALQENPHSFRNKINVVFIENRKARYEHLERVLAPHCAKLAELKKPVDVKTFKRDCNTELNEALDKYEKKKLPF